jgi:ribosome-binding protein aMBF1 (putative translation factor)
MKGCLFKEKNMEFNQEKVRELRLKMGWSQSDLARRLELQVQVISDIEKGLLEMPEKFRTQLVFLMNQLESITEEIHLQPHAENILENEGLHQIIYSELRDKVIR